LPIFTPTPYNTRRTARTQPRADGLAGKAGDILPADVEYWRKKYEADPKAYPGLSPEKLEKWKLAAQKNAALKFAPVTSNQSRSYQMASAQQAAARVRRGGGGAY
jgi:hypothetical protein